MAVSEGVSPTAKQDKNPRISKEDRKPQPGNAQPGQRNRATKSAQKRGRASGKRLPSMVQRRRGKPRGGRGRPSRKRKQWGGLEVSHRKVIMGKTISENSCRGPIERAPRKKVRAARGTNNGQKTKPEKIFSSQKGLQERKRAGHREFVAGTGPAGKSSLSKRGRKNSRPGDF